MTTHTAESDRKILQNAPDDSSDWNDDTWAAWFRVAERVHGNALAANQTPWQRAVDGLNALVDADIPFHIEPDGHISNPAGDEHIEWDRDVQRWRLVHDEEAA